MTSDEVETLVRDKTRNTVRIQLLEEREGDAGSFLSYSVDDRNQLTIWHTEVPPSMQHKGVGGRLVEKAIDLAQENMWPLRVVCPFAKDYLARHPEPKKSDGAAAAAVIENESLVDSMNMGTR